MRAFHFIMAAGLYLAGCGAAPPGRTHEGLCLGEPVFEAAPLNACTGPARIRLAVAGDVLLHGNLAGLGYEYGFAPLWSDAVPLLAGADLAVVNLEGPVAPGVTQGGAVVDDPGPVADGRIYTDYPRLNYHPAVLTALRKAGVDLITTANNHALDRGPLGADLTLAEAAKAGLDTTGTIRRGAAREFVLRRQTGAGVISFVACSFSANGIADPGRQVLLCYGDRAELLALVRREADDPGVDAVIVLPHWGVEYRTSPEPRQVALARDLAAAGATAVVGTHPHVVQPFAVRAGPGGQVPVAYSTGNFIAQQPFKDAQFGAIALLDLCPGAQGLVVHRAGWVATEMKFTPSGYYLSIAPAGMGSAAEAFLKRIAPGFSAQPMACG